MGLWVSNFWTGGNKCHFCRKNGHFQKDCPKCKAKHMELKYFAVKEEVQKYRVLIEHISTNLMIADPLTKGLLPKTFTGHVVNMGVPVRNTPLVVPVDYSSRSQELAKSCLREVGSVHAKALRRSSEYSVHSNKDYCIK
uniref:CCHC-type domain-containing protein n=1 Tax=Cajanus cajan TaxID=3821 RepID=A0A151RTU2_CAJCA|nr:hypothetical protein KK1_032463 [Cajanus cajan]